MEWSSRKMVLVLLGVLGPAIGLVACDDPTEPVDIAREDILKTYDAFLLTTTTNGFTINHLAAGATLNLTLRADGSTAGRVFIPDVDEGGGDFEASLDGQFRFDEETDEVTLQHAADTFLRDMILTATGFEGGVQLEGEETFSGTLIRLILR